MQQQSSTSDSPSPLAVNTGHLCYGCNLSLDTSPMIASVSGHHKWHIDCLRCCECDDELSQERSCFIKNGRVYCRDDYAKLISESVRCAKCFRSISPSDWVRKAGSSVYHLACFACDLCQRQLSTGEQFTIDSVESKLLCKLHFGINKEVGDSHDSSSNDSTSSSSLKPSKTKRVRTTFTEEQLQVLQANFQIDSNPDGQDLERIAGLTGLSKRVTQVWFQNSRARQKKYMNKSRSSNCSSASSSSSSSSSSCTASVTLTSQSIVTTQCTAAAAAAAAAVQAHSSSSSSSSSSSPASSLSGVINGTVQCSLDSTTQSSVNGHHSGTSSEHLSPIAMLTNSTNVSSVATSVATTTASAVTCNTQHAIHPGHHHMLSHHHSIGNHIPCHGGLPPLTAGWIPTGTNDTSHRLNGTTASTVEPMEPSHTHNTTDLISNLITNNNSWSNMTLISSSNGCESIDDELTREASPV